MKYLDPSVYESISQEAFLQAKPFPHLNPSGALRTDMFEKLAATMPDVSLFTKTVGMERRYGQQPHDRYELFYTPEVPLSPEWKGFIAEIYGDEYQKHISRIFGIENFVTRVQWQYAYSGCSVSPHCDSPKKIGSQLFYMNTPEDWDVSWGGRTLILNDGEGKDCNSAPALDEFTVAFASEILPNRSLLFKRTDHSWHAVEELRCPEGKLRKLFTVVFDKKPETAPTFSSLLKRFLGSR